MVWPRLPTLKGCDRHPYQRLASITRLEVTWDGGADWTSSNCWCLPDIGSCCICDNEWPHRHRYSLYVAPTGSRAQSACSEGCSAPLLHRKTFSAHNDYTESSGMLFTSIPGYTTPRYFAICSFILWICPGVNSVRHSSSEYDI